MHNLFKLFFFFTKLAAVSSGANLPYHPSRPAHYSPPMAAELLPEIPTRTVFIAGQSPLRSHSQLEITVNSFLSHTGCFTLLIQSEMRWLQRSHCFLYERSACFAQECVYAGLRVCVSSTHVVPDV